MTRIQWITALISLGAVAAAMTGPVWATGSGSQSVSSGKSPINSVAGGHPVMIQGTVAAVYADWATVQTPSWRPYCPPKTPCPMIIIDGVTYEVNIAHASYEGPAGLPTVRKIAVGEQVVIAGATPAPRPPGGRGRASVRMGMLRTMTAEIIETEVARSPVVQPYKSAAVGTR